jgi:hypothetical protein
MLLDMSSFQPMGMKQVWLALGDVEIGQGQAYCLRVGADRCMGSVRGPLLYASGTVACAPLHRPLSAAVDRCGEATAACRGGPVATFPRAEHVAAASTGAIVAQLTSYDDAGENTVVDRRASSPSGPCTRYDACTPSGMRGARGRARRGRPIAALTSSLTLDSAPLSSSKRFESSLGRPGPSLVGNGQRACPQREGHTTARSPPAGLRSFCAERARAPTAAWRTQGVKTHRGPGRCAALLLAAPTLARPASWCCDSPISPPLVQYRASAPAWPGRARRAKISRNFEERAERPCRALTLHTTHRQRSRHILPRDHIPIHHIIFVETMPQAIAEL